ncbi:MAG: hypothetical protein EA417_13810 [Gammaproteobacteria bacterium]|nr:MAG: hypothetical protein EA417_13810 [Gammaproteobacteria bacterium]
MSAATISVDLVARTEQFARQMEGAAQQMERVGRRMQQAGRTMSQYVTAPLVAVGAAAVASAVQVGRFADELLDLEQMTGISTDGLQQFRALALEAGVAADTVANAVGGLTRRLASGEEGSAALNMAMQSLGVSLRDTSGELRPMEEIVGETIRGLAAMENVTERNAAAYRIFGGQARQLAPILGLGSDAVEEAIRNFEDLGLAMDRDALEAANQFRVELDRVRATLGAAARELGVAVIPILQDFAGFLQTSVLPTVREWIQRFADLEPRTQRIIVVLGGVAAAIGPIILALGGLTAAVGTLTASLGALLAAMGPAGWLILGLAAAAAGVTALAIANRDGSESFRDLADAALGAAQGIEDMGEASVRAVQQQLLAAMAEAEAEVAAIQARLDRTFQDPTSPAVVARIRAELEEAKGTLAGMEEAYGRVASRLVEIGTTQEGVTVNTREQAGALAEVVELLTDQSRLLSNALDLDIESHDVTRASLETLDRINRELARGTHNLQRTVELTRQRNQLQQAIAENLTRRIGLDQQTLTLASGLNVQLAEGGLILEANGRVARNLRDELGAATDEAGRFESAWLTALQVVGASMGGIVSQVGNIAAAFVMGGPGAGLAAFGGAAASIIRGDREQQQRFRDAADNWERALDDFVDLFADRTKWERMLSQVEQGAAELLSQAFLGAAASMGARDQNIAAAAASIIEQAFDAGGIDAAIAAARRFAEILGLSTEQIDQIISAMERHREAIAEQAEAEKILEEERRLAREAAEEAAEAERQLALERAQVTNENRIAIREALLAGDQAEALRLRAEADLEYWRDLYERGQITAEQFQRIAAVISGELANALAGLDDGLRQQADAAREAARAAYEAAQAERFRQQQDMRALEVRLLRAQGRDREAQQLQDLIAVEAALQEGRDGAYISLLQQVQAEEARARAMRSATEATQRTTQAVEGVARALNAPAGFRMSLARWRSAGIDQAVANASPSFTDNSRSESTTIQSLTVQMPAGATADDWDRLIAWARNKKRAGAGNPFELPGV